MYSLIHSRGLIVDWLANRLRTIWRRTAIWLYRTSSIQRLLGLVIILWRFPWAMLQVVMTQWEGPNKVYWKCSLSMTEPPAGWPSRDSNYELLSSKQIIKTDYLKPKENNQKQENPGRESDLREGNGLGEFTDFRMFSLNSRVSGNYSIEMLGRNTRKDKKRQSWGAPNFMDKIQQYIKG